MRKKPKDTPMPPNRPTDPPGLGFTMVTDDLMIVGGIYDSPEETLHWAKLAPPGPPIELAVIDPNDTS